MSVDVLVTYAADFADLLFGDECEQVERIVRCKECGDDTTPDGVKLKYQRYCILQDRIVESGGFCAWGERRQDA